MKPTSQTTKTVKASELSTLKMTCGNEKKYSVVIHDGIRKQWVGIGWVDEGAATAEDKKRYPKVV
jgi:hypothetical protein